MVKKILAIILAAANIFVPVKGTTETQLVDTTHYYPATMYVADIVEEEDLVVLQDSEGFQWEFYGVEDWFVGDLASVLMYDNGTTEIYDDQIMKVRYAGIFDGRWVDGMEGEW